MSSFFTALQELKALLTDGLQTFCSERWGKLPKVTISYKKRAEIALDEFPRVFITRPTKEDDSEFVDVSQGNHSVLLYVGFCEHDAEKAAEYVIKLEEEIEALVTDNFELNGTVEEIVFVNSVSDEGNFHPVYFQVIELRAIHQP